MHRIDWIVKGLLAALVAGVWTLVLQSPWIARLHAQQSTEPQAKTLELDELTVKRINVIEDDGKRCMVLANSKRFPLPMLHGKEWPRTINPAGVVFYKRDGDECGGIALAEVPGARKTMLIFDYGNSEAIGVGVFESQDGESNGGVTIADRLPLDTDIAKRGTTGPERVSISNEAGVAQIVLSDSAGKPHLRMTVDKAGAPKLELIDADGKIVFHAPQ